MQIFPLYWCQSHFWQQLIIAKFFCQFFQYRNENPILNFYLQLEKLITKKRKRFDSQKIDLEVVFVPFIKNIEKTEIA